MSHSKQSIATGDRQWLKNNIYHVKSIKPPGETWTAREIDIQTSYITHLKRRGMIRQLGFDESLNRGVYRTTELGYRAIQEALETRESNDRFLPCDHSGIRNLGNDRYTCAFEKCDKIYSRDEVNL